MFFSTNRKVYKSTENGLNPKALPLSLGSLKQIFIPKNIAGTIFFVNSDLYQSNDGGRTAYFSGIGLPYVDEEMPPVLWPRWGPKDTSLRMMTHRSCSLQTDATGIALRRSGGKSGGVILRERPILRNGQSRRTPDRGLPRRPLRKRPRRA